MMTIKEARRFWMDTYIAAVRAGNTAYQARTISDAGLEELAKVINRMDPSQNKEEESNDE